MDNDYIETWGWHFIADFSHLNTLLAYTSQLLWLCSGNVTSYTVTADSFTSHIKGPQGHFSAVKGRSDRSIFLFVLLHFLKFLSLSLFDLIVTSTATLYFIISLCLPQIYIVSHPQNHTCKVILNCGLHTSYFEPTW